MKPIRTTLLAAILAVPSLSAQEEPAKEKPAQEAGKEKTGPKGAPKAILDPMAQDTTVTLTCKPPKAASKVPNFRFEGQAQMPDTLVLQIELHKVQEEFSSGAIQPRYQHAGSSLVQVRSKKIVHDIQIPAVCPLLAVVTYVEDFQPAPILESVKDKYAGKYWKFEFPGWNEDLLKILGDRFPEVDALSTEGLTLLNRMEKATASEAAWKVEQKSLTADLMKFMNKAEKGEASNLYPAAVNIIFQTVRNVYGTAPYFIWSGGAFAGGKSYHADNAELKTYREEKFTFDNLKKYVLEAPSIAGRELALWICKEIRRNGSVSPAITELLRQHGEHAGLSQYTERLKVATPADTAEIEKVIRQK